MKVLVGCTGSVATIKVQEIIAKLQKKDIEVQLVVTQNALHFLDLDEMSVKMWKDEDEWKLWGKRGDPVLHIELRKWADVFLISPLDANTLAKISQGICDNLITCIVRAWDLSKPLFFCPAMNTCMWQHPLTEEQIGKLKIFGYIEIPCVSKKLVCGDTGMGAMANVDDIVSEILKIEKVDNEFKQDN